MASSYDVSAQISRNPGLPRNAPVDAPRAPVTPVTSLAPAMESAVASAQQDFLWLQTTLAPVVWQACAVVALPPAVDVVAVERGLATLVGRHAILRTTFTLVEGQLMQVVHPATAFNLTTHDLTDEASSQQEPDLLARVTMDIVRQPYVLADGPLFRAHLLRLPEGRARLVICAHSLVCSASALAQALIPELAALCATDATDAIDADADQAGCALPTEPLTQYASFAVQQREALQSADAADALTSWERRLADSPFPLDLPYDRPRPIEPTVASYTEGRQAWSLPQVDVAALVALTQREGVALEALLLAALAVFVARHTGQDDLLLGAVAPTLQGSEPAIGPCGQPQTLRLDLSGAPTLLDLAYRAQAAIQDANAHRAVPFEYALQKLQSRGGLRVQVALQMQPATHALAGGWQLLPAPADALKTSIDLSVVVEQALGATDGALSGEGYLAYNADLFDTQTVARMARRWETLLAGIAADPAQSVWRLPLLPDRERRELLETWNATDSAAPVDCSLSQPIEQQVARTPDACAVVIGEQRLTYGELNSRANQLARYLQKRGVGPNTLVGLCVERSPEMVVGMLGILKAGGAYVPLDPEYPPDRLQFMLADSAAPVLVTRSHLDDVVAPHATAVVRLDADWPSIAAESDENLEGGAASDDLAYIIYTSGSTGQPKGVLVSHRNVVNSTYARLVYYREPVTAYLMLYSYAFDGSVGGLFSTLWRGGTLILPEPGEEHDPTALARLIARHGVSHVDTVTTLYGLLLQAAHAEQMASVRTVIIGAEACPSELPARHYALAPQATLYNEYGPTETTVWSTVYAIPPDERRPDPPIGRPIVNTRVYLLDSAHELTPFGVVGQLYIGGAGVTQGYLHRPDLTEARFAPDPFSGQVGARMYQTGDLARYLPDGNLQFVGRVDTQVKLHGFRIELGEIETALSAHPGVVSAVVSVREDVPGQQRLVAYIVPTARPAPTYQEMRQWLRQRLPTYMIPTSLVAIEALPVSPNGKLNRAALPAPVQEVQVESEGYVAPEFMIHYQLVAIWESLLDVRPIGIRDNFFDLGGNSFLAARLVASIEQTWHIELPLKTLFVGPTVAEIAAYLLDTEARRSGQVNGLANGVGETAGAIVRAPIVAIQAIPTDPEAATARRPFFYLHAEWRGGAFYCFPLARALGPEQPFYVLEPYRFDTQADPPSFQEMAAAHREAMQSVQPAGPYYLGGFCAGALIAYEIARQLQAAGEHVDLLLLTNLRDVDRQPRWARAALESAGRLLRMTPAAQLDAFLALRHLAWNVQMAAQGKRHRMVPWASQLEMRTRWTHIFDWVAAGYRLGGYSGDITLLWSSDEPEESKRRWQAVMAANQVTTHALPGDDMTCRTTYLSDFASRVRACLSEARTRLANRDGEATQLTEE